MAIHIQLSNRTNFYSYFRILCVANVRKLEDSNENNIRSPTRRSYFVQVDTIENIPGILLEKNSIRIYVVSLSLTRLFLLGQPFLFSPHKFCNNLLSQSGMRVKQKETRDFRRRFAISIKLLRSTHKKLSHCKSLSTSRIALQCMHEYVQI